MSEDKFTLLDFKKPEPTETEDDINVDTMLEAAKGELSDAILIGWTTSGNLYLALSQGGLGDNFILLEAAKKTLVDYFMED